MDESGFSIGSIQEVGVIVMQNYVFNFKLILIDKNGSQF